ncbi:PHD finger protein rhinoceros isoform X2 [Drosophila takahashii]|uniref:PHD finger protein rhinoceros isoform X2 n=1 Tax=Drosophila takahashii TaxID=29030 RepID=UPI003898E1C7
MNGLSSNDDAVECPLCMEPLEVDDLTFFPCTCGYQICRFCWHRIRTDENKLCPACRKEYPENPADFKPLSQEEMIAFKSQKRQRDQQRKQKITENRKHLANVRVVQKNLVFVVGLPPRLADADILKKHEYFGKYGKIHKVVINPSTTYAGITVRVGPSASAYVTYVNNSDALRAIQSVNNIMIDGRLIKTSLGTTKYCSHFMKNQQCPKGDCMYLHELGDPEASFTKEEMHQGKHQEYEKRLHDTLIASFGPNTAGIINGNGASKANAAIPSSSSASSSSSGSGTNASSAASAQQKEAWPSLSVSPINGREATAGANNSSGKSKREKLRNEKRHEKNKAKNKNKENYVPESRGSTSTETFAEATADAPATTKAEPPQSSSSNRARADRGKDRASNGKEQKKGKESAPAPAPAAPPAAATKQAERIEPSESTITQKKKAEVIESCEDSLPQKRLAGTNVQRSVSSCSETSEGHVSESSLSEKSLPGDYAEEKCNSVNSESQPESVKTQEDAEKSNEAIAEAEPVLTASKSSEDLSPAAVEPSNGKDGGCLPEEPVEPPSLAENGSRMTDALSKLNIFDDTPSFFTSPSFQQVPLIKNKLDLEMRQSHLPDLVNEWEEAFKNVMIRNTRHVEEQLLQQQHLQQQQQHHHQQVLHQQEEFLRMHELQKRNNFATNISQMNGPANDILSHFQANNLDFNRVQAHALLQQQLLQQQSGENLFGGNMSKFFDFHKSQQQSHHQYLNGHPPQINGNSAVPEPQRVAAFLENNRLNSPFVENGLINSQQQPQKRMMGMFENLPPNTQSQQSRFTQNSIVDDDLGFDPFIETQKGLAELMENEVVQQQSINNENPVPKLPPQPQIPPHQQLVDNMQRARMPPPGFNHMNTLGLGGASRLQQHTSKMMPFMNMPVNGVGNNGVQGQHQVPMGANWNAHLAMHQNPGQPVGDSQLQHPMAHNKVYNNSDWTSMDPAILSFRQFSSFPQNQIPPHPQQQQDMFLQHLAQQQNSQSGFNNQPQQLLPMGMPNNLLNGQQSQPPQVNANVQGMLEFLKSRQFV